MTKALRGSSHFDVPVRSGFVPQQAHTFEANLAHELSHNDAWSASAENLAAWRNLASAHKSRTKGLVVRMPSSGYYVHYLPSVQQNAEQVWEVEGLLEAWEGQAEEGQAEKGQAKRWLDPEGLADQRIRDEGARAVPQSELHTDALGPRLALLPKLLKEIIVNPFRDFTLVKRDGEVFVVEEGVDLSGKDLSGVDLHQADLRGANLRGTLLAKASLEKANLRQADLTDAVLQGANLRNADLSKAILDNCDLRGADWAGAAVDPEALAKAILEREPAGNGG